MRLLSQVLLWRRKLLSIAISNKVTLQGKSIRTSLGSIQHGCLMLIKFNPTLTRRKLAAPFLKGLLCLVVQTVQAWDGGSTLHPCGQAAGKASRSQQTSAILLSWLCYGKRMNAVAMSLELFFFLWIISKCFWPLTDRVWAGGRGEGTRCSRYSVSPLKTDTLCTFVSRSVGRDDRGRP